MTYLNLSLAGLAGDGHRQVRLFLVRDQPNVLPFQIHGLGAWANSGVAENQNVVLKNPAQLRLMPLPSIFHPLAHAPVQSLPLFLGDIRSALGFCSLILEDRNKCICQISMQQGFIENAIER